MLTSRIGGRLHRWDRSASSYSERLRTHVSFAGCRSKLPNGNAPNSHCHQAIIDAIDGATTSIQMTMFHLTDQAVIQELVSAAQRGIKVQILLDPSNPNLSTTLATLKKSGIQANASSPCFNMTHEKAFVIDAASSKPTSFLGAMNMTGRRSIEQDRQHCRTERK
jgi:phosphatidylserine/phosphatidylglycerophosphate/cardiolipin synthase-like enzyme